MKAINHLRAIATAAALWVAAMAVYIKHSITGKEQLP